jgi:hypothetical protein
MYGEMKAGHSCILGWKTQSDEQRLLSHELTAELEFRAAKAHHKVLAQMMRWLSQP